MKLTSAFILILLSITSCDREGDFFFLINNNAEMPIVVKGKKASNVFILFLHGGPGNGTYIWERFFEGIEKKCAMVYWNQRAAGETQGNTKASQMTVAQFVDDLDKVITLINHLYDNPKIYLMGHSWGGLLGTAYLIAHPNKVSGWIEVDGAHNKVLGAEYSKAWVMNYAQWQINRGSNVGYWQNALEWYNTYSGPLTYTSKHYTEYLDKAHAYFYREEAKFYSISDYFFGRPNGLDLLLNGTYSDKTMGDEIVNIDLTPQMSSITIPSLILWGRHDGTIPYQMAENAFEALGTATQNKSIMYFENSAHSPMIEENLAFNDAVIAFIKKYN
jgi:proline iminopeptidase